MMQCPMCQSPLLAFENVTGMAYCPNGCGTQSITTYTSTTTAPPSQLPSCLAGYVTLEFQISRIFLDPLTEASPPILSLWTPTVEELTYCVAQDSRDTVETAIFQERGEAADYASLLLYRNPKVKRVVFYDHTFTFLNALSRTGYVKKNSIETISEHDKKVLLKEV